MRWILICLLLKSDGTPIEQQPIKFATQQECIAQGKAFQAQANRSDSGSIGSYTCHKGKE